MFVFDASNINNASLSVFSTGMYGATPIYVRGTMNGWSTDDQLFFDGSHVYSAVLALTPGNYEFKIASEDWSAVDLGAGQAGNQLNFGEALTLAAVGGDIGFTLPPRQLSPPYVARQHQR